MPSTLIVSNFIGDGGSLDNHFFIVFAAYLVVFPLSLLFIINIALLAGGPVLLVVLGYAKHVVVQRRLDTLREQGGPRESFGQHLLTSFKSLSWVGDLWRLGKFWLMVVLSIGFQILLIVGYVKLNPFVRFMFILPPRTCANAAFAQIVYSHPYLVFISTLSLAYLSTTLLLALPRVLKLCLS